MSSFPLNDGDVYVIRDDKTGQVLSSGNLLGQKYIDLADDKTNPPSYTQFQFFESGIHPAFYFIRANGDTSGPAAWLQTVESGANQGKIAFVNVNPNVDDPTGGVDAFMFSVLEVPKTNGTRWYLQSFLQDDNGEQLLAFNSGGVGGIPVMESPDVNSMHFEIDFVEEGDLSNRNISASGGGGGDCDDMGNTTCCCHVFIDEDVRTAAIIAIIVAIALIIAAIILWFVMRRRRAVVGIVAAAAAPAYVAPAPPIPQAPPAYVVTETKRTLVQPPTPPIPGTPGVTAVLNETTQFRPAGFPTQGIVVASSQPPMTTAAISGSEVTTSFVPPGTVPAGLGSTTTTTMVPQGPGGPGTTTTVTSSPGGIVTAGGSPSYPNGYFMYRGGGNSTNNTTNKRRNGGNDVQPGAPAADTSTANAGGATIPAKDSTPIATAIPQSSSAATTAGAAIPGAAPMTTATTVTASKAGGYGTGAYAYMTPQQQQQQYAAYQQQYQQYYAQAQRMAQARMMPPYAGYAQQPQQQMRYAGGHTTRTPAGYSGHSGYGYSNNISGMITAHPAYGSSTGAASELRPRHNATPLVGGGGGYGDGL